MTDAWQQKVLLLDQTQLSPTIRPCIMLISRTLRSCSTAPTRITQGAVLRSRIPISYRQFSFLQKLPTSILNRQTILSLSDYHSSITSQRSSFPVFTSIRFKSTSTSPSSSSAPAIEPFDSPDAQIGTDLNALDFSTLTEAQKALSEHIGYLHDLGLNFGWGPTSVMQWFLEHIHIWSSTPWWASILLTTLVVRLVQLPFYIKVSDQAAKMKEVQPYAQPLFEKLRHEHEQGNVMGATLVKSQLQELYNKAEIQKSWLFFPITQVPIFYGMYNLLRHMADLPVPGFLNGGLAWFSDLTSADPYMILPIITSVSFALSFHMGGEAGASSMSKNVLSALKFGLPVISFFFMWKWAAAMTMYFAFNGLLGLTQAILLRNPAVRQKLEIYPLDTSRNAYRASSDRFEQDAYDIDLAFRSRDVISSGLDAAEENKADLFTSSHKSKSILNKIKSIPKKLSENATNNGLSVEGIRKKFAEKEKINRIKRYEVEREKQEKAAKAAWKEQLRRKKELKELEREEL